MVSTFLVGFGTGLVFPVLIKVLRLSLSSRRRIGGGF
jgi:hypothetical protein